MNLKIKGVYLTERDLKLMRYLHAVKVATYDQIARDAYSDYSLRGVGNRLRKLENNRFISSTGNRLLLHGKRIVSLTKLGFEQFVKRGDEFVNEFKSQAVKHDLALNDIRSRIVAKSQVRDYQTENEIKTWNARFRKLNSDALFTLDLGKGSFQIPLEYESSMKKTLRYEPIVKKYYQESTMPFVAYIADSQNILDKVSTIERKLYGWNKPKFFYRLKQDFLADEALHLENYDKFILAIGE